MIKISKLNKSDIPQFRKLFLRVFSDGFGHYPAIAQNFNSKYWSSKRIEEYLPTKNRLFLLAQRGQIPVGFLIGKCYSTGTCSILWVGVLKKHRGEGIGKKLVSTWEKWGRKMGAKRLRAATTNPENEKFYTKLGYKKSPETIKNDWGMPLFIFLKTI